MINAAAYRAVMLTSASRDLCHDEYWKIAERNLNFVLENQNPTARGLMRWMVCGICRPLPHLLRDEGAGEDPHAHGASPTLDALERG